MLLQLGLSSGLNRELPFALGSGQEEYSARLVGETTLVLSILMAVGLVVYSLVIINIRFSDFNIQKAFLLSGVLAFSSMLFQVVILRLRCERRLLALPVVLLSQKIIILVGGVIACYLLSFAGPIICINSC